MRLDERKDIQSVKSPRSILHSELKASVLLPLERNNKDNFLRYFILLSQARKSSFQMWSNMLLKNIYMHSFNLLNYVLLSLNGICKFYFPLSINGGGGGVQRGGYKIFFSGRFSSILQNSKCHLCYLDVQVA